MKVSIIICTYNPDERLLQRALLSVTGQAFPADAYEIILVDNNSDQPVSELACVKQMMSGNFRLIREPKPGLSNARITGVNKAQAPLIVFADDDNELSSDYLSGLLQLQKEFPEVGIWGPGSIQIDFIDGAADWVKKYMPDKYQYRAFKETKFGCEAGWKPYFPTGSGIALKKEIFLNYLSQYQKGEITLTGRIGESLASGEDSQIVWSAIKMKTPVGTSPLLKLIHIIPGRRTELSYLERLNYNVSYSFYSGQYEMFRDQSLFLEKPGRLSNLKLLFACFRRSGFHLITGMMLYKVEVAWRKGYIKFHLDFYNK
jgi:glycosyltransferase involved in cell wall biosynthesis